MRNRRTAIVAGTIEPVPRVGTTDMMTAICVLATNAMVTTARLLVVPIAPDLLYRSLQIGGASPKRGRETPMGRARALVVLLVLVGSAGGTCPVQAQASPPPASLQELVVELGSEDLEAAEHAGAGLIQLGPDAAPAIEDILIWLVDEAEGRVPFGPVAPWWDLMEALPRIAPNDPRVVSSLVRMVECDCDESGGVHQQAIRTLQRFGPVAREAAGDPLLRTASEPGDPNDGLVELVASTLAVLFGDELPQFLVSRLAAEPAGVTRILGEMDLRTASVKSLGLATAAIPELTPDLDDISMRAVANIALALFERTEEIPWTDLNESIEVLRDARTQRLDFEKAHRTTFGLEGRLMDLAISGLTYNKRARVFEAALHYAPTYLAQAHVAAPLIWLGGFGGIWLLLLWLRPLWLLNLTMVLDVPKAGPGVSALSVAGASAAIVVEVLSWLFLLRWFRYPRRSLRAWTHLHLDAAQRRFEEYAPVKARREYVPLPITVNERRLGEPGIGEFRAIFKQSHVRLVIYGEGGAGKSSLAYWLARVGMRSLGHEGLSNHPMIPLLVDHDLDVTGTDRHDMFFQAVRGKLQSIVGSPDAIPEGLAEALLRKGFVLVVFDGLSERDQSTRELLDPADPRFPAAFLIVTSRAKENIGGTFPTLVCPSRLTANRLSSFIDAYLTSRGARDLFDDTEYFELCRRLSLLLGGRDATVLLAKLFVELMIARKGGPDTLGQDIPQSASDLTLQYLNLLNRERRQGEPDNRTVHDVCQRIAWSCVKKDFRPGAVSRKEVLDALTMPEGERLLTYLETRLQVIDVVGPAETKVRFTLDPIAEYLAAQFLVGLLDGRQEEWDGCIEEIRSRVRGSGGDWERVSGFVRALHECCSASVGDADVPARVAHQLRQLLPGSA